MRAHGSALGKIKLSSGQLLVDLPGLEGHRASRVFRRSLHVVV